MVRPRSSSLNRLDLILASHPQPNNKSSRSQPLERVRAAPIRFLHLLRISSSHHNSNRTRQGLTLPHNNSSRRSPNSNPTPCSCKAIKCRIIRTCLARAKWAISLAHMQVRWAVAWVAAWAAANKLLAQVSLNSTIKCRICRISNLVKIINRNLDNTSLAPSSSSLAASAALANSHNRITWAPA